MDENRENEKRDADLDAFGLLVKEHQAAVRAFVLSRINDPFEAHDLAQEVFLIAFRKIGEIDAGRPIRPWLIGIALNEVRNHQRKRRALPIGSRGEIIDLLESRIQGSDSSLKDGRVFDALEHCLGRLEESARRLLQQRYVEGMGISEICSSEGKKHSAITMKLHRLREKLRHCIENQIGEAVADG